MIILAFDSTAKAASVAVCDGERLLGLYNIDNGLTQSELLLPMAENLLSSLKLSFADIGLLAASVGPGSFTGVRIGVSLVKGIAFGRNIPCVAVSTLAARADCHAVAVDLFPETVEIAGENAEQNGVGDRLGFLVADVLEPSFMDELGDFDFIISNPPYIVSGELDGLEEELSFEPRAALDGGADGLKFYSAIISNYGKYLRLGGGMLFEIGYDQADAVSLLAHENGYSCEIFKDYGGNDRVALLRPENKRSV